MAPYVLVGRYVRVALWNDLAELLPGGPVGLIVQVADDGDEVELRVQLLGFRTTFEFSLGDVELLPSDYTEATLFTATHPAEQGDTIDLHMSMESARFAADGRQPVHRVAARLSRDGHRLIPLGSFSPGFDPAWTTPVEPHINGSVTAQGPIPKWLFVG